jgi:hypothetical protein
MGDFQTFNRKLLLEIEVFLNQLQNIHFGRSKYSYIFTRLQDLRF